MAGAFTTVNLSQLPPPDVVETLDYEVIVAEMLADLQARDPSFSALVESDPAFKVLEVAAYRELLLRQRVNDAAHGVMLAFARGADLDQIGANRGVARLVVDPGDPLAVPPAAAVMETDEAFRARIQLSPEGYTTAGSEGSYVFHALGASGDVLDVQATSPSPGVVNVYVLSATGDGEASPDLIGVVNAALNADTVRPLTDIVTVYSATIVPYTVTAQLVLYPGPDSDVVLAAALAALSEYVAGTRRIGWDVTRSGIFAALHRPGVQRVVLTSPAADVVVGEGHAGHAQAINVTVASSTDV